MEKKEDVFKFSMMKSLFYPLNTVISHLGDFFILAFLVAVCDFFLSLVLGFGHSFLCSLGQGSFAFLCIREEFLQVIKIVPECFLVAYFVNRFYQIIAFNKKAKDVLKQKISKKDFEIFTFVFLYIVLFCMMLFASYMLYQRKAEDNFSFEVMYFVFWSGIFVVIFLMMFYSVLFYRFLQGKSWALNKDVFWKIQDNLFVLVFSFSFYVFFLLLLGRAIIGLWRGITIAWLQGILYGLSFEFFIYVVVAIILSSLKYQAEELFKE